MLLSFFHPCEEEEQNLKESAAYKDYIEKFDDLLLSINTISDEEFKLRLQKLGILRHAECIPNFYTYEEYDDNFDTSKRLIIYCNYLEPKENKKKSPTVSTSSTGREVKIIDNFKEPGNAAVANENPGYKDSTGEATLAYANTDKNADGTEYKYETVTEQISTDRRTEYDADRAPAENKEGQFTDIKDRKGVFVTIRRLVTGVLRRFGINKKKKRQADGFGHINTYL